MRTALGASRGRLARALLSESVVLALAGGAAGVVLAQATTAVLRAVAPAELPRVDDISVNPTVLVFTLAISVTSGLLFGLIAVLRFGSPRAAALKEGGRSTIDAPGRRRTRHALVVGQVALALTLLVVAGLMIRTFLAMRHVDPGFSRPNEVQTFVIAIPPGLIRDPEQAARTQEDVAARAGSRAWRQFGRPFVVHHHGWRGQRQLRDGRRASRSGRRADAGRRLKSFGPGYFETMGNRIVAGRSITWPDDLRGRPLVVISETLARAVLERTRSGAWQACALLQ